MTDLERYLQRCITVADLKQALEEYPDDMPVLFAYRANDHWGTEIAAAITDEPERVKVTWSGYHNTAKAVRPDHSRDENDYEGEEMEEVLIIGGEAY